ncbi:uncharacterized protein ARMOST_13403 [Armillaria ostoyae]|uniref:J domain-containing protein n=1 Tax=Armillaria ostoyae TaxID=47428 RepID=A0A284RMS6_ARMOS|nr:uncharacterized protein ARMOST_13403 [Armillaria ostoyae]
MSSSRSPTPGVQMITRKVIRTLEGLGEHTVDEESSNPSSEDDEPLEKEKEKEKTDWEIPRKVLHSSIGFGTLYLYVSGGSPAPVTRVLWTSLLFVILPADILRLTLPRSPFAGLYNILLGPLMRPSERTQTNGVIYYILGVNIVLTFLPLDVAVVSILILSWADTAASTFGRMYGRWTPKLPWSRRKSLAGNASKAQIKSSFYQLSKTHHPDLSDDPDSPTHFRRASEAYAVLSDDRQRRAYDRTLVVVPPHPRDTTAFRTATWETRNKPPSAKFAWTPRKPRPLHHQHVGLEFGSGLRDRTHPAYQNVSQRHSNEHKAHIAFSRISGTVRALQLLAGLGVVMWVLGPSGKDAG